jgi:hypothetical protein
MTQTVIEPGHLNCPNCATAMKRHRFASTDVRPLEVDVCYPCHAIWFDAHESARLAPDGVVDLFRLIHSNGGAATGQLSARMKCTRCHTPLSQASDIARNNRFSYYRCAQGHGRLTTFLHFLREKQFVRDLTVGERQKLAAHVRQIRCTSCSGPIDIAQHAACSYCGAAVSVLDKDATQKALDHYLAARQKQGHATPTRVPAQTRTRGDLLDYVMFDIGTDIVGAFARSAARATAHLPAAAGGAALMGSGVANAALPDLTEALSQSGLGESLSLLDPNTGGAALGGELGASLADSAGAFAESVTDVAGDVANEGGLVDLVSDGIGAIVEGLFN